MYSACAAACAALEERSDRTEAAPPGLEVAEPEVDKLFDAMDPDGSGSLTLSELNKQLRTKVELDAALQAGAAGEIATESTNKVALRKGKAARAEGGTKLLQGFDIDESSDKPVAEQARAAAAAARFAARAPQSLARACLSVALRVADSRRAEQERGARGGPVPRMGRRRR